MARRNSYPGDKWYQRPDQAYARTTGWPTRYYQRKVTGSMVAALSGLNTTSDDFAKREGESPYLWNARLNGTEEKRKRAQSMSRMGQQFICLQRRINLMIRKRILPAIALQLGTNQRLLVQVLAFLLVLVDP